MSAQEKSNLLQQIDQALNDVRPHLAADGGDVEVVDVTDDMTVMVKWLGNCENCFMSLMTMKAGIEQSIKSKVPGILHVEAVNGLGMETFAGNKPSTSS
mgnify:CR=1 FL=1